MVYFVRNSAYPTSSIRGDSTGAIVTYAPDIEAMGVVLGQTPDEFATAISEEQRGLCGEGCAFDAEFAGRIMELGCEGCKAARFRQCVDDVLTVVRSVSLRHEAISQITDSLAGQDGDRAVAQESTANSIPPSRTLTAIHKARNPNKRPMERFEPNGKFL